MAQHFSLLPRFAAFARSSGSASRFDAAVVVEPGDSLPVPKLRRNDLVLTRDNRLCVVSRVGWFNDPSPWIGDDVLRAFVVADDWQPDVRETHYSAWIAVTELTPVSPFEAELKNALSR